MEGHADVQKSGIGIRCKVGSGEIPQCLRIEADFRLFYSSNPTVGFNVKRIQKGHVTLKW